jgi:hypothetical protein
VRDCCVKPSEQFSGILWREQVTFRLDNVCFVLDQHAWLDFYSACLPKQQSAGRCVFDISITNWNSFCGGTM